MPFVDCTSDFKQALVEKENDIPEARRKKFKRKAEIQRDELGKNYLEEAYNIVSDHTAGACVC